MTNLLLKPNHHPTFIGPSSELHRTFWVLARRMLYRNR